MITCPYLGLKDDPDSFLGNPSPGNYCRHCKFPVSPLTTHQETACLAPGYLACPVYAQDEKKPFPKHLQSVDGPSDFQGSGGVKIFWILIGVGLLVILGWLSFQFFTTGEIHIPFVSQFAQPGMVILTETKQPTPTPPLPTETPAVVPTQTPHPTATLVPTSTKTPPQRHALEVPVKVDNQEYLIHLAMDGDGFEYLAKTYKTTTAVIQAINYLLPPTVWVNLPIVVSPGVTTINPDLPALKAYQVVDQEIDMDALAKKLQVDIPLFRHFNACPDGCKLVKGDWVLVPYPKKGTP